MNSMLPVNIHCCTHSPEWKTIFGKSAGLWCQILCCTETSEENCFFFHSHYSDWWVMRKYPKVNTCPFGWKIPAVVLLNNSTAPPFPCFPVHCGMTNKQVQAEEESNILPPHQGSVAVFLKASWCTSAESLGLWMNPHSKELHVVQTFTRTAWQCFCSLWWTLVPCVKGHKGHEWA